MAYDEKIAEWNRLNYLGYDGCAGAISLRLSRMDEIAKEIGYPLSLPVYKEELTDKRNG